jgi:NAD(P)-dependent dehydrogenase (short-subunit alcohol dehydrogenase family)
MRLKDKVVIVTGAARGIGKVLSKGIAAEGAKVVLSDILDGEEAAGEIRESGGEAVFVQADVSSAEKTLAVAKTAHEKFGRIDGLVNNAAFHAELKYIPFDQIDEEEWDRVFAVNVKGTWQMTKAVYPYMKEQGSGKIINIGSSTPFKGTPKMYHYVASKGAIMALTRSLARTVGKEGICVNCVTPGLTRSDSVVTARGDALMDEEEADQVRGRSIQRGEMPEDLVGAIVFFLSEGADFITGQTLLVEGGGHMI